VVDPKNVSAQKAKPSMNPATKSSELGEAIGMRILKAKGFSPVSNEKATSTFSAMCGYSKNQPPTKKERKTEGN
jgi:hypothetical protein